MVEQQQRIAAARQALANAEVAVGLHRGLPAAAAPSSPAAPSTRVAQQATAPAEPAQALRARADLRAWGTTSAAAAAGSSLPDGGPQQPILPDGGPRQPILPDGGPRQPGLGGDTFPLPAALSRLSSTGLRRGSTVSVTGSTSLLLAMAAAAAGSEGWLALVGLPHLSAPAAAEAGIALDRAVMVPHPGGVVAEVLGALIDGFDVLVLGATAALRDQDRRRVRARLRSRGAVLLGTDWPGGDLVLDVEEHQAAGLGQGWGAVAGRRLHLVAYGRVLGGQERRLLLHLDAEGLRAEPAGLGELDVPAAPAECAEPTVPAEPAVHAGPAGPAEPPLRAVS